VDLLEDALDGGAFDIFEIGGRGNGRYAGFARFGRKVRD